MERRYLPLQTFNGTQTISRCAIPIDLGYHQSAYTVNYVPAGQGGRVSKAAAHRGANQ